jgi:CHAT domain-containing protein/tetratricopeptide (TPR) repeat protein
MVKRSKVSIIILLTFFLNQNIALTYEKSNNSIYEKANSFFTDGKYDNAIMLYKQLVNNDSIDISLYSKSFQKIALINYYNNNIGASRLALSNLFKPKVMKIPDKELHSVSFYLLAMLESAVGNYEKADSAMQISYKLRKEVYASPHRKIGNCLVELGGYQYDLGNLTQALNYYKKAHDEYNYDSKRNYYELASLYFNIGILYHKTGNFKSSIKNQIQGYNLLYKFNPDDQELPDYLHNIGNNYLKLGDFSNSIRYFKKSIILSSSIKYLGIKKNIPIYLNGIGYSLQKMKHYKKALDYHHKSINEINIQKNRNRYLIGLAYSNIGIIYRELKDYKNSHQYHEKADSIFYVHKNNKFHAANMIDFGMLFAEQNKFNLAKNYFNSAIKLLVKNNILDDSYLAHAYFELAKVMMLQENYASSLKYADASINYNILSKVHNQKEVIRFPLKTLKSPEIYFKTYALKGQTYSQMANISNKQKQVNYKNTYEFYFYALEFLEQLRINYMDTGSKLQLYEDYSNIFEKSIDVALILYELTGEKQYLEKAFEFSERNKAGILLETMRRSEQNPLVNVPDSLLSKQRDLNTQIAYYEIKLREEQNKKDVTAKRKRYLENTLFNLKQEKDVLLTELQDHYNNYYDLLYKKQYLEVSELQQRIIDDKTVLIEFFIGDSTGYSFAVTKSNIQVHKINDVQTLNQNIASFRDLTTNITNSIQSPDSTMQQFVKAGNYLATNLIEPIINQLPASVNKIVFIADGGLGHINLELLPSRSISEDEMQYSNIPYLIRDYTIQFAYSASVLKNSLQSLQKKASNTFAGFAPNYKYSEATEKQAERYYALPGAKKEVKEIAQIMDGDIFTGAQASKTVFEQHSGRYKILHLAMHGHLDDENPLYSKLIFSQVQDSADGKNNLNAIEIFNLDLSAELIVLSACNTGSGKIHRGEGIMSLSRAFKYAGAKSLLMSLWQIPDKATQQIMVEFYDNLLQGKRKDTALREAKLSFLENVENPIFAHPYYWSGLIAIGDMSPISTSQSAANDWYWLAILLFIGAIFAGRILSRKKIPQL